MNQKLTFTCDCGQIITFTEKVLGKKLRCKSCKEIVQIPKEFETEEKKTPYTNFSPTSKFENLNVYECPFCAEEITINSSKCPRCNENLTDNSDIPLTAEVTADLLKKAERSINGITSPIKMTSRISIKSIILFFITALFSVGTAYHLINGAKSSGDTVLLFILVIFIIIFLTASLQNYSLDSKAQLIGNLTDPENFVKQYFSSIRSKRTEHLYEIIAPTGKSKQQTEIIEFDRIHNNKRKYNISSLAGFKKYWKFIKEGPSEYNRSFKIKRVTLIQEKNNKAIIEVELKFSSYNSFLFLLIFLNILIAILAIVFSTKKEAKVINKLIIKKNDVWYIAEGELQGPLDRISLNSEN